ncbi:MAG: hypothetical protein LBK53_03325 [Heliobacteriaceae bacterium]|jgi:hypothetical protein|nr:hypothetical protein [Heliobacteriaceae bacterium]
MRIVPVMSVMPKANNYVNFEGKNKDEQTRPISSPLVVIPLTALMSLASVTGAMSQTPVKTKPPEPVVAPQTKTGNTSETGERATIKVSYFDNSKPYTDVTVLGDPRDEHPVFDYSKHKEVGLSHVFITDAGDMSVKIRHFADKNNPTKVSKVLLSFQRPEMHGDTITHTGYVESLTLNDGNGNRHKKPIINVVGVNNGYRFIIEDKTVGDYLENLGNAMSFGDAYAVVTDWDKYWREKHPEYY